MSNSATLDSILVRAPSTRSDKALSLAWLSRWDVVAPLASLGCLGWCLLADLAIGPLELCHVVAGLVGLWLPLAGVAYVLLAGRCTDALARATLSILVSYGLTTPIYAAFGDGALAIRGFQKMFYVAQILAVALVAGVSLRVYGRAAWAGLRSPWASLRLACHAVWRRTDWTLVLLIALSILTTRGYKTAFLLQPDQASRRLAVCGDTTYFSALAYELGRQTPAVQQSMRAGIKERAYHMYPHLTTMLISRFAGQPDMLDALTRYHFTVIEVLTCLAVFCMVRTATGSRPAGYIGVALVYILSIPLPPVGPFVAAYFYFTWLPHATSTLEPSVLSSPQTYVAVPVILGVFLCVQQLSTASSRRARVGVLAVLAGLLAGVLVRFRVQAFLILFPGVMIVLAICLLRTRNWRLVPAGCLAVVAVTLQLLEMRLPVYYPESASLLIHNNRLGHNSALLNAWPGGFQLRAALDYCLHPEVFSWTWQFVCAAGFAIFNMIGLPMAVACAFHWFRRDTWRSETWGWSALLAWSLAGTIIGSTCLSTPYDHWSIGGQSLFLVGWYLLPLLAIGLWRCRALVPRRLAAFQAYAPAMAVLLLLAACTWQRTRASTPAHAQLAQGPLLSEDEWDAMNYLRTHLPKEAVLVTKALHHPQAACMLSGIAGRATYLEYFCIGGPLGGSAGEQWGVREARINRMWETDNRYEFEAYVLETRATHLVEYADAPLRLHSDECLEEYWSGRNGKVKVWKLRTAPGARENYELVRLQMDPAGKQFRAF